MTNKKVVLIAGASGYVGKVLAEKLCSKYYIVGLSRSHHKSSSKGPVHEWRKCDLFSLLQAEYATRNVYYAFYLVHSMMPSARLSQGNFQDFDLIVADNFARACKLNKVKKVIFLSGLIPEGEDDLSKHLASRLEVEQVLRINGPPLCVLRSSIIIGSMGSSFIIIYRLVKRLPFMVCPSWTNSKTQPVSLIDVVNLLEYCLENNQIKNEVYDIGGPDVLSYLEMIYKTAEFLKLKRYCFIVPIFSPILSSWWVSLITGAPVVLICPLIYSLKYKMIARDRRLQDKIKINGLNFKESLELAFKDPDFHKNKNVPLAFTGSREYKIKNKMRSVQRFPLPSGKTTEWLAAEYLDWLPTFLRAFLRVEVKPLQQFALKLKIVDIPLLVFKFSEERSYLDRILFYIEGGILIKTREYGRLEFRKCVCEESVIIAVHNYEPSLPWYIYEFTQAKIHLFVMGTFKRHLQKIIKKSKKLEKKESHKDKKINI